MKNDLSYSPSDVFLTFPRPSGTDRLAEIGIVLDDDITAYGFLEAGAIRLIDGDRQTLAGTGLGLKVSARKSLSANVDVAWPLKSTPAADGGKVTSAGKPRVHVRLAAEF